MDGLIPHDFSVDKFDFNLFLLFQLSLALADLALQMASWKEPIMDLVQRSVFKVTFICGDFVCLGRFNVALLHCYSCILLCTCLRYRKQIRLY